MLFIRSSLGILILFLATTSRLPADSTAVQHRKFSANLSGSLLSLYNWKGESLASFTILSGLDYYSSRSKGFRQGILSGKSELGFTHIIDSVWTKQSDRFNMQYLMKKEGRKFSHSLNTLVNSQFLNSYKYEIDVKQKSLQRKWTGTFMNPSTVELGYGMNLLFWKKSSLNIAIASARFRVDPVTETALKPATGVVGKVKRGWLLFDYGISGQLFLIKNFSKELEWNATGKLFLKGFEKEAVQFDISNTMSYKFWKYLEMRADLKWVYDPLVSFRMQYRNELLFGFIYKIE